MTTRLMSRAALATVALLLARPALGQRTVHLPLAAQLPLGPRTLGMGGPNAGVRDAESALGNPALVSGSAGLGASAARYRGGAQGGVLATSTSAGTLAVSVAVSFLDYGLLGNPTTPRRVREDALTGGSDDSGGSLAAAVAVSTSYKGLRWGAGFTALQERVGDERGQSGALNMGVAKDGLFGGMTVGLAVQGIGPSMRVGTADYDLPTRISAGFSGISFPVNPWLDVTATGGVGLRVDGLVSASVGAEASWVPLEGIAFSVRSGVRRAELASQRPYTGGFGVTLDRLSLDYAWEQLTHGGAHRIGVRIR